MAAIPRKTVIAAVYPLAAGAAQFNAAMVKAMTATGPVELLGWRRMYPPLLHGGQLVDTSSPPPYCPEPRFLLDWHDPRTWREALRRVAEFRSDALVLPWLHPVMTPPYRYLLAHAPRETTRVVICHNVVQHEPLPGFARLTRAVLRHADLLVTHAPQQRAELAELGLGDIPFVEAFHPRFVASDLAYSRSDEECAAERARQGSPDLLLLTFGSVRPYKGVDLALEALALVDPALDIRLVVAGRFWNCADELRAQADRLGLDGRLQLRDEFVSGPQTALLFGAADAALLPYRSASQSGVVQLAFAYGRPVIATRVGGLPAAVEDGRDGILCEPGDPAALARAIERMAHDRAALAEGVRAGADEWSFERYAQILDETIAGVQA
jgi:glycosyltransferase involved in cell wall biosynthesis